jgi:von Willebrand factor type A domain
MPRRTISCARRHWLAPWLVLAFLVAGFALGPVASGVTAAQTLDCASLAAEGAGGTAETGAQSPSAASVYDYALVIDISRSMSGGGGSQNIFPEVKAAIIDYLNAIPAGANIRIIPFSGQIDSDKILSLTLNSDSDRQQAVDYVKGLVANGQGTWIYNAVDTALDALKQMRGDDTRPHVQSLLLYTDGRGNGPNDRPVSTLINRLNVARADQQYLYVKYVALGTDVPGEDQLKQGGIDVVKVPEGVAPAPVREVGVAPSALDLGAVTAGQSASVTRQLCTLPRVGDATGQDLHLAVNDQGLPDGVKITVDSGTIKVGAAPSDVRLTIDAGAGVAPGAYRAQLNLTAPGTDNVVPIPGAVGLTFEVGPASTPTPTATPPPTATPTPGVTLGQSLPLDLGKQKVNLESDDTDPVVFTGPLDGDFAGGAALALRIGAMDASNPLTLQPPTDVFFRSGEVDGLTEVQLQNGSGSVDLVAKVDRAQARALGKGTYVFHGQLVADADQAAFVPEGAVQQPDGTVILPFVFRVEVYEPFDPIPWIIGAVLGLAGFLVLGLIWSTFPRLPTGSALLTPDGHVEGLREAQAGRLLGRLFGGRISIGGNGSAVNLGLAGTAGVVRGRWLWPKRTLFEPQRDDIRVDGEPLEEGRSRQLETSERLEIDRQTYTYVERRQTGRATRDDDEDYAPATDDELDDRPRRRRFARRSRSYDEDEDY